MSIQINDLLQLTEFHDSDIPNMVKYLNDEELYSNTLNIPKDYQEKDAVDFLTRIRNRATDFGQQTEWVIRSKEEGLIGGIGLLSIYDKGSHKEEIGYWLAQPFRKKGIMTEVVRIFSDYCINTLGYTRIEARTLDHNAASRRVLEKAGFEQEGYARKCVVKNGIYLDCYLFAKVKQDDDY